MSLKQELNEEDVAHFDLSGFCQIDSGMSTRAVLEAMRQNKCAACLVMDGGKVVGIFTERDVLNKVVGNVDALDKPVNVFMTADPQSVHPESSAAAALALMDEQHIRDLPVVSEDGTILGGMTYKAIIEYLASRYPVEVLNRPPQPNRFPRKAEGG